MTTTQSTMRTYAQIVRASAERSPDTDALVFPDARLTYRELLVNAMWRARELQALGVTRGGRFGVLMPNSPEFVELLVGAGLLGATLVPINTRFKARELRHVIVDAELTALVTTDVMDEHVNFKALLYEALPGLEDAAAGARLELADAPFLQGLALVGERSAPGFVDGGALRALAATQPEPTAGPAPDDIALILYTSGTTAHPKGCMLTHRAIVLDAEGIAERFQIPPHDRWWDPLPMFHAGALMLMSGVFVAGATFMSMARFDPDAAFDLIERERATVLYPLFPTITLTLMHHPRFASLDLSGVRLITNVAPPDVQRQIQAAFEPAVLMSAYGITELCGTLVFTELDDPLEVRVNTCGVPLPGFDLRIVEAETGEPLPPGERGELVGRGPSRFEGYYNNPEQTELSIDQEGYFHTGDLCSIDEAGRISFHGRLKDMLKVGGENVAAIEIESVSRHPPLDQAGAGRRRARRPAARGPGSLRRARTRREPDRARRHRVLPGVDRVVQGAPPRALRRGVADVRNQGPEVQPPRSARRRARVATVSEAAEGAGGRDLFSLAGKTALVTGGARGVGLICAEALLAHGAAVIITTRREEAAAEAISHLSQHGPCTAIVADLSTEAGVAALVDELSRQRDSLHILVNNAGVTWGAPFEEYPASAWTKVLNLDVASAFQLVQHTVDLLEAAAQPGDPARVVNIGSVDGSAVGTFDNFAYSAAKAGIHHLTRVLARRLGGRGITVNCIAPGPIRTKMTAELLADAEPRLVAATPLGRLAESDDVAGALVYLTALGGAYVTGSIIPVDGGATITTWGAAAAQ